MFQLSPLRSGAIQQASIPSSFTFLKEKKENKNYKANITNKTLLTRLPFRKKSRATEVNVPRIGDVIFLSFYSYNEFYEFCVNSVCASRRFSHQKRGPPLS
jgi:hypothetical protein